MKNREYKQFENTYNMCALIKRFACSIGKIYIEVNIFKELEN